MTRCLLDLEVKSIYDLKLGTYIYAEGSTILIFAYQIDDGPVKVWDCASGAPMPDDLRAALEDPTVELWAHNAMFDRAVMLYSDDPAIRAAAEAIDRWHCSMALAYAHGMPGALEALGDVLQVAADKRKLKTGRDLMRLFCIKPPKNTTRGYCTPESHPKEWAEFKDYATGDIVSMSEVIRKSPHWNYRGAELTLWRLDAKINQRGVCVDLDLARAAVRATDTAQAGMAARTKTITDDEVGSTTQRDVLLKYLLAQYGVELPDMQSATLERRIDDPGLPDPVRELLAIRLQASSTSVAKYKKLLGGVNTDGRLRGTLQFCGAARTGRWAGRLVQLQNLPRPTLPQEDIDFGIKLLKLDAAHLVFDNVMGLCASALRGFIVAAPGKKLVVADLANIEGRMAAWLAGEDWKVQAFRDYDAGTGPDMYKLAYARAFAVDHTEVSKDNRQIGKVMELMLQYQGGVGAFITGAATYGIDLDDMAEKAWPSIPADVIEEAESFLRWLYEGPEKAAAERIKKGHLPALVQASLERKKLEVRHGLTERTFVVCDSLKRMWRRAHPAISSYWKELEDSARLAIHNPGTTYTVRRLKFRRDGAWLRLGLPSGRVMCFPNPQVDEHNKISYMGVGQYSRRWERIHTYGGKFLEGSCQAASRDQLAYPMPAIEAAGFEIATHVHDELITEAPIDRDDLNPELLGAMMCSPLGWNDGLPLAAAGWQGPRYRKE